jgi:hypothetical protein
VAADERLVAGYVQTLVDAGLAHVRDDLRKPP